MRLSGLALAIVLTISGRLALADVVITNLTGAELGDINYDGIGDAVDIQPFASAVGNKSWATGEFRTALEFDLSAFSGLSIQQATLKLHANWYRWSGDHPDGGELELYAYVGNGTMETSDYSRLDYKIWSGISDSNQAPTYGDLHVDVTSGLEWLRGQSAQYGGFILENASVDDANDRIARGWYINDFSSGQSSLNYVSLEAITAVPEPSAFCLSGLGILGFAFRRGKRRSQSL